MSIYLYVMNTLADWEIGLLMCELNTGRFFSKNVPKPDIHLVGANIDDIITMGGFHIQPNCSLEDVPISKDIVLILPGSNSWDKSENYGIIEKAKEILNVGGKVCAICGATVALANAGILDKIKHTSNGVGFLDVMCPTYKGKNLYINEPAVSCSGLITGASTASIEWTKLILESLNVMTPDALNAWYDYFSTGNPNAYFALMEAIRN